MNSFIFKRRGRAGGKIRKKKKKISPVRFLGVVLVVTKWIILEVGWVNPISMFACSCCFHLTARGGGNVHHKLRTSRHSLRAC